MIEITIPETRLFNDAAQEFVLIPETKLTLEHSLVSISKWESKWHKTFLSSNGKTFEEQLDYFRCMTLNENIDPNVYYGLTEANVLKVNEYIENPMTATRFRNVDEQKKSKDKTTSELIYYWMIELGIPFECQYWHLNRLLTLIEVCSRKKTPPKKHGKRELMARNNALNAKRRQALGTRG